MAPELSDAYYRGLEARLRVLRPLVGACIPRVLDAFTEYLDAGEYGLAVEVATEALGREVGSSEGRALASGLVAEATVMELPRELILTLRRIAEG